MLSPKIAASRDHSCPATESLSKSIIATILSVYLCRASNQGWQTGSPKSAHYSHSKTPHFMAKITENGRVQLISVHMSEKK